MEFTVSSRSAVDKRITPGFRSYCTSKAAARFSRAASARCLQGGNEALSDSLQLRSEDDNTEQA